jgi:hypothetical protein
MREQELVLELIAKAGSKEAAARLIEQVNSPSVQPVPIPAAPGASDYRAILTSIMRKPGVGRPDVVGLNLIRLIDRNDVADWPILFEQCMNMVRLVMANMGDDLNRQVAEADLAEKTRRAREDVVRRQTARVLSA